MAAGSKRKASSENNNGESENGTKKKTIQTIKTEEEEEEENDEGETKETFCNNPIGFQFKVYTRTGALGTPILRSLITIASPQCSCRWERKDA